MILCWWLITQAGEEISMEQDIDTQKRGGTRNDGHWQADSILTPPPRLSSFSCPPLSLYNGTLGNLERSKRTVIRLFDSSTSYPSNSQFDVVHSWYFVQMTYGGKGVFGMASHGSRASSSGH